ncbi:glycine cleavage system protein GcvH [Paenibacillus alginolyticus]|jgi:glycine cleavage system H protein|uniref:Glycine cleavage system H protein n=2 Tax=Paenibacillus TaxID=44249 RepID=A0ABX1Z0X4_9BACL|nr:MULTISPECIES: glycine cleavage system protein GcvH [Paenibacillus]MCY9663939.1 glycine cleavage system protein GcvH [Paenibacillus alginolyticus]MCY9695696.1 glycine cleavage system protein GcvH [Paenibacillus alginolyticus]MEC0142234.1 glycine cleavage system protein GcvH [Paenibacillus alginolyticus]NOU87055.1 glycine cleavage system protein GcvH [Paenibacillus germinis]
MSEVQANLFYTKEHEWVEKLSDTVVRVGITDFAQDQLGDIVFVELPKVGTSVTANESIGSVESVKTVSDIFSPVSGKVTAVNSSLEGSPELVNSAPFSEGWMVEVEVTGAEALEGLLTPAEYASYIGND